MRVFSVCPASQASLARCDMYSHMHRVVLGARREARPLGRRFCRSLAGKPVRSSSRLQAASAEQGVQVEEEVSEVNGTNGSNGTNGANGASMNGNGATMNGSGTAMSDDGAKVVNITQGSGASPVSLSSRDDSLSANIEGYLSADEAGHLESAAQSALAKKDRLGNGAPSNEEAKSKMPYKEPGGRWGRFKSYSTFQRTWEIWTFAATFFFKLWLVNQKFSYKKSEGGMTDKAMSAKKSALAVWLREGLVKLGPTFIKIGQQFSTRVDVLSPEFIKELEMLQDNVPSFPAEKAVAIVENGLGKPIDEVFEEFDREPIAAASLGQVHVAKLNGERVVVKVQRPGLKDLFDIDLKNVRVLAEWLQKVDPKSDGAARDWVAIYDECSRILYQEIDYTLEGKNADRFRTNFESTPWIKVPRVLWDYTTPEVLTLEYVPGVKINRAAELDKMGVDRKLLARRTVESYLQQLLTYGFFHADPHPGNIAVDAEEGGRLIYYDFGMMGTIPNDVRGGLLELFYGVYKRNVDGCLDALVKMGVLVPGGDRTAVRRTGEFFLQSFEDRLNEQKEMRKADPSIDDSFKPQRSKDESKQRRKQILASIGEDLLVASADKPFRFPATFTFVVRSFTVLDGIGKALDPRFDISEISAPYARELLLEGSPQYAKLQEEWGKRIDLQNRAFVNLFKGPNMIQDIYEVMRQLERGDLKLRVRALEAERAISRVATMQKAMMNAIVASMLVNMGTVLSVSAMGVLSSLSFAGSGLFGVLALINLIKVRGAEKKEAQLTGSA
jgi:predicted unusual protein kinase regulating ubiquinone biosynthesis (AarF/ABC1/UbiB family)